MENQMKKSTRTIIFLVALTLMLFGCQGNTKKTFWCDANAVYYKDTRVVEKIPGSRVRIFSNEQYSIVLTWPLSIKFDQFCFVLKKANDHIINIDAPLDGPHYLEKDILIYRHNGKNGVWYYLDLKSEVSSMIPYWVISVFSDEDNIFIYDNHVYRMFSTSKIVEKNPNWTKVEPIKFQVLYEKKP